MAVNGHGIITDFEEIPFGDRQTFWRGSAEVCIGEHAGRFFWSITYQLPNQGSGYSPGPHWHPGVVCRTEAESCGVAELKDALQRVIRENIHPNDSEVARKLLAEIIRQRDQLSLF